MQTKNLLVSGFTLMIVGFILLFINISNIAEAKYTIISDTGQVYFANNFKIIASKKRNWEFTSFEDSRGNIVILNSDVDIVRKKTDAE